MRPKGARRPANKRLFLCVALLVVSGYCLSRVLAVAGLSRPGDPVPFYFYLFLVGTVVAVPAFFWQAILLVRRHGNW
jgi:hypothetical protein